MHALNRLIFCNFLCAFLHSEVTSILDAIAHKETATLISLLPRTRCRGLVISGSRRTCVVKRWIYEVSYMTVGSTARL